MRFVASPKPPDYYFVRNVTDLNVAGAFLGDVLLRRDASGQDVVNVVVCQDARMSWDTKAVDEYVHNIRDCFSSLFSNWGQDSTWNVSSFCFFGDNAAMMSKLHKADIFVMGGVFPPIPSQLQEAVRPWGSAYNLVQTLQTHVRSGKLCYFGICGGAVWAGNKNPFGLHPLDIFDGVEIDYQSNCRPSDVANLFSTPSRFPFPSGCAFAFKAEGNLSKAMVFANVKNRAQWYDWALANGIALQSALMTRDHMCHEAHGNPDEPRRSLLLAFAKFSPQHAAGIINALPTASLGHVEILAVLRSEEDVKKLFNHGLDLLEAAGVMTMLEALLERANALPPWPKGVEMKELNELLQD